jgi:hypothetical protein
MNMRVLSGLPPDQKLTNQELYLDGRIYSLSIYIKITFKHLDFLEVISVTPIVIVHYGNAIP